MQQRAQRAVSQHLAQWDQFWLLHSVSILPMEQCGRLIRLGLTRMLDSGPSVVSGLPGRVPGDAGVLPRAAAATSGDTMTRLAEPETRKNTLSLAVVSRKAPSGFSTSLTRCATATATPLQSSESHHSCELCLQSL